MIKREDGAYIGYDTLLKMYEVAKQRAETVELERDVLSMQLKILKLKVKKAKVKR